MLGNCCKLCVVKNALFGKVFREPYILPDMYQLDVYRGEGGEGSQTLKEVDYLGQYNRSNIANYDAG